MAESRRGEGTKNQTKRWRLNAPILAGTLWVTRRSIIFLISDF